MGQIVATRRYEPLPRKMQELLIDELGRPVPWFVAWVDGKPEFRAMDGSKYVRALKEKLCWVCGGELGTNFAFVAGPMCGVNRISVEPPSHLECARWSARNCPFLSNPEMVRREDQEINNANFRENASGVALTRNPGVAMLWITRNYEVFNDGKNKPLILMGRPRAVEWYAHGRLATRAEVEESIEEGLLALEAAARMDRAGSLEELAAARRRFERWLPA